MEDVSRKVNTQGTDRVSSWAGPGTGSAEGTPAGPAAQRQGKDSQAASSSPHSCAVAASAIIGIGHTGGRLYASVVTRGGDVNRTVRAVAPACSDLPPKANMVTTEAVASIVAVNSKAMACASSEE